MAVEFGNDVLWPLLSLVAGCRQRAGQVYYWAGSGSWGKSQFYALGGVAMPSWLAMVWTEMGPGYCQAGVSGFTMAVGREMLRCGLLLLQRLVTGGVWARTTSGSGPIIRASIDYRRWSVGLLIVGCLQCWR